MKKHLLHLIVPMAIMLGVLPAIGQGNKTGGANRYKDNFFIKAIPSKTSCMVNEPVLVDYKLFYNVPFSIKSDNQSMPTFTGCTVQEMTMQEALPTFERLNGRMYQCISLRKVQIYPLHAGNLVLGALSMDGLLPKDPSNVQGQTYSTSSQPLVLHVADFPVNSKPLSFGGAVGHFSIKAAVGKLNDTANENNNLQITIEGEGSFQNVDCPTIAWPANMEHFEASASETMNKASFPVSGSKTFNIPFIAKAKGNYTIPPVIFSFYDMNTHAYKTVSTQEIVLHVDEAKKRSFDETKIHGDITNHKYIWIVVALGIIVALSLAVRHGLMNRKKPASVVAQASSMIEEEITKQEEREANSPETDAVKLNRLLLVENDNNFFSEAKAFSQYLLQKETDDAKRTILQRTINDCNAVLYASASNVSKDDVLMRLEGIIEQ